MTRTWVICSDLTKIFVSIYESGALAGQFLFSGCWMVYTHQKFSHRTSRNRLAFFVVFKRIRAFQQVGSSTWADFLTSLGTMGRLHFWLESYIGGGGGGGASKPGRNLAWQMMICPFQGKPRDIVWQANEVVCSQRSPMFCCLVTFSACS